MTAPRRSIGPIIAYMLTLLGLLLGGIWVWNAVQRAPAPNNEQETHMAPPRAADTPSSHEELNATDRQQLEDILRRKSGKGPH